MDSLQLPGTSSSAPSTSVQSHKDTVSPFLSQTEGREFRDSDDCESESEEEAEAKGKFTLSAQSAKLLTEVTAKPLKNTKRRQLLDRFPQPAMCDQVYPPKLDESISLIIPHSSRKEDTLLSRLQEQLAEGGTTADPKNAIKTLLGNAAPQECYEAPQQGPSTPGKRCLGLWVFGKDFGTKAKSMSDSIKAHKTSLGKGKALFFRQRRPFKETEILHSVLHSEPPGPPHVRGSLSTLCSGINLPASGTTVTPSPQGCRTPVQTPTSKGLRTTAQLGSATVTGHGRSLSVMEVSGVPLAWSSYTAYYDGTTQLVAHPISGLGNREVPRAIKSSGRASGCPYDELETIEMGSGCCLRLIGG